MQATQELLRVSVIIATKDRWRELTHTVRTLFAQLYPPDELIVVDQSSDDRGKQSLEALIVNAKAEGKLPSPRLTYLLDSTIIGAGAARNEGIERASGDIIVFLDDDVELEPEFLREMIAVYDRDPTVAGVSGTVTNYRKPSIFQRLLYSIFWCGPFHDERQAIYWNSEELRDKEPIPVRKFGAGGMSLRASVLGSVRFDARLRGCPRGEDVDLCCRLPASSLLVIAPRARYVHLGGGGRESPVHWLRGEAQASYYLYHRNWSTGWKNRLCFLWLNVGYYLAASLGCLRRLSLDPWRSFRAGVGEARMYH